MITTDGKVQRSAVPAPINQCIAILLNGPSSSGKSTLAKALQALVMDRRNERYAIISIDDYMKIPENETIYEDDVFEISGDLCQGALDALKTSDGVIIDHVITSKRIYQGLRDALQSCSLKTVRVTCPLDILKKREAARGNRCLGSAESSDTWLYPKDGYDFVVDTGRSLPSDVAEIVYCSLLTDQGDMRK